jgi:hypothetical protein
VFEVPDRSHDGLVTNWSAESCHGKSESELPFVNPIQILPAKSSFPEIAAMIRAWVNPSGSAVDRSSSFHRSVSINGARYYISKGFPPAIRWASVSARRGR